MYTQKIDNKLSTMEIFSLESIPEIVNSRIVEQVPHPGKGYYEIYRNYVSIKLNHWLTDSAKVQINLSQALNLHSKLISQIVEDGLSIAKRQGVLYPGYTFYGSQDLDINFQKLLQKKIKYLTLEWVMEAKLRWSVSCATRKYYLKYTDDFIEVNELYTRSKTVYSEILIGTLYNQYKKFLDYLDMQIERPYSKFFQRQDYSEKSRQEGVVLQTVLVMIWYKYMKDVLEEVTARWVELNSDNEIEIDVEKITDEQF
ncbi:MAG: hypothetical protein C5B43_03630 [Verrucomicrobia bacterium]|nr:MAG: hypothetical protein C5B43_03630 [Verrucomicrobiota bacterium]